MKRILCQYASVKKNANRNSLGEREKLSLKEMWKFTGRQKRRRKMIIAGATVWVLTPKAACFVAWYPGWHCLDKVDPSGDREWSLGH